jgi:hypothetical protein
MRFNKRGLLMRNYLIILVLFSVFTGVGALIVADIASVDNGYGVTNMTDSDFDSAYNQASYTNNLVEQAGNVSSSNEGLSTIGSTELLFGSTKTVIQLVFGSFSIIRNVFSSMLTDFGMPPQIANLAFGAIISILIIIIVFVVISSLTKTKM